MFVCFPSTMVWRNKKQRNVIGFTNMLEADAESNKK